MAATFSLVASGLVPANAQPVENEETVSAEDIGTRADTISAQITAKATGARVEDLSQRTETEQVFANPDGSWTSETSAVTRFVEKNGDMIPIAEVGTLESAGETVTGAGTILEIADGQAEEGDGPTKKSVPLATLTGTGEDKGKSLELGWEGELPVPEVKDNTATYSEGVQAPVIEDTEAATEERTAVSEESETAPATETSASTPESSDFPVAEETEKNPEATQSLPEGSIAPEESDTPQAPETSPAATAASEARVPESTQTAVDATVSVSPTRTGFSHLTILDQAPEGDVELRFPLKVSKGLSVSKDKTTGSLHVKDAKDETVFFAPTPLMWDAKIDEASGIPAAETGVETELMTEGKTPVLVLKASKEWLQAPERQYPVTIDPTWSSGASDTFVQNDNPDRTNGGSTELRVGTFDAGKTRANSYIQFAPGTTLTGKKITKAEVRLNNYYSYTCYAAEIRLQRVTTAWATSTATWNKQPLSTRTGEGINTQSKGYNSSCAGGYVYFPATAIAQHWADNPTQNFGVKLIAAESTNNYSWKRYRSANYILGENNAAEPQLIVTYNSYPNTPSAVTFGTGQSVKDSAGKVWVKTLKPQFRSTVADPDVGNVKAEFDMSGSGTLAKAAGNSVASKSVSTYAPTLIDGGTYTVKAWANDGTLRSKAAGTATTFTVNTSAPGIPTVTSSAGYTDGTWKDAKPASNTFTFSSSTDTNIFQYQTNNDAWKNLTATAGKATLSWNPTGSNVLRVKAIDLATNISTLKTFTFGNGVASLTSPTAGMTTSDAFKVKAAGPASSTGVVSPKVYWREADSVGADKDKYGSAKNWHLGATLSDIPAGQAATVDTMVDISVTLDPTDDKTSILKKLGKDRIAALVEIQVCFDYAGAPSASKLQCTTNLSKKPVQVTRLPHAFGNNYPTAEAGDGQVALTTGELNLSETDISVDAGNTGLSLSRSYSSYSGIGANSHIFGAGWRGNIGGSEEGLADLMVAESTAVDGSITLISDDETAAVFRQPGNGRTVNKIGTYAPANEEANESGWKVALAGSGTSMRITVTEDDGTVTKFKKGAILASNQLVWEWIADTVSGGNTVGVSTFVSDTAGRITKIVAGTEGNLNCDPTPVPGCRVLNLSYDGAGKLTKVTFTAFDAVAKKMATVNIAEYGYDGTSRDAKLTSVTDSRTGDITAYTYVGTSDAGVPLVGSIKEMTGDKKLVDAPTYYEYGPGNNAGRPDWLEVVKRGDPTTGVDKLQLARFVYGVPVNGNDQGLPNLSNARTKLWNQEQPAATGYAVFGPGLDVASSKPLAATDAKWKYADLQYVDANNRVVNTSSYAAGQWQSTAQVFNGDGNIVRSYDARGIRNILSEVSKDPATVKNGIFNAHEEFASINSYYTNEDLSTFVDAEGEGKSTATDATAKLIEQQKNEATAEFLRGYVKDTYSPVTTDENSEPARVRTNNTYTAFTDVDAGGMPRMLILTTVSTKAAGLNGVMSQETELSKITNGYNAFEIDGQGKAITAKENKRSGWVVGSPTTVTTAMAEGTGKDIEVQTRFDDQGRVKESRQPASSSTAVVATAGATKSVYYTSGVNADDAACGNKPEYAGYLCKTTPQGAGSVAKHQTGFNIYGQPSEFTEDSTGTDGAVRTTKQTYRNDGQELTTTVTISGMTGSTAVPAVTKLYDASGVQNEIQTGATKVTWTQDLWGRTTSYTNSAGVTTTTEYDSFGNVKKTVIPNISTTEYKYGALSGEGITEYQGVVTSMTVSGHGSATAVGNYKATYDGDGNILQQVIPGGFTQENEYEEGTGKPTGLSYSGPVKDAAGKISTATWIKWSTIRDVTGRIVGEETPDGDLISGNGTNGDRASDYDKSYTYDRAGRLTKVVDLTAAPGEEINTDPEEGDLTPVTTRNYTFDKNGNRTKLATSVNGTQTATRSWAYDAADRVSVSAGYTYDGLGRQTKIPAMDAPRTNTNTAATGDITIGYYADDAAQSITRNGITTTIERDPAGRRLNLTATGTGNAGKETKHYADASDNPAWSTRTVGSTTTTTRYESTIGGDLALSITNNQVELAINNPHGDTVTTIPLTGTGAGQGINGWAQYDEYGNQLTDTVNTGATTYGWHGADQRALDASGLILMGARLYNSITGLFTSRDPVDGGNSTTYAYPQDPIGMNDILGLWGGSSWSFKSAWGNAKAIGSRVANSRVGRFAVKHWQNGNLARYAGYAAVGACVVASMGACGAAALVSAGISGASRLYAASREVANGRSARSAYGNAAWRTGVDLVSTRLPGLRSAKFIKGRHALRPKNKIRYRTRWKPRGKFYSRTAYRVAGLAGSAAWARYS